MNPSVLFDRYFEKQVVLFHQVGFQVVGILPSGHSDGPGG